MSNGLEVSEAAYSPTSWVDGTTPVNAANLNKLEAGLQAAALIADQAKAANPPSPTGQDGKWLTVAGGAMVWAAAPAGGGGGLDWEGAYGAATPYVKGDVVTYGGVVYGAVNDSTGQTPPAANQIPQTFTPIPLVIALPTTPFDGQEVYLVDSLTAPTFSWHLKYVAAKASNKWMFVGGEAASYIGAQESRGTVGTYGDLGTIGPQVTVPVTGFYMVEFGAVAVNNGGWTSAMSISIGGAAANDGDGHVVQPGIDYPLHRVTQRFLTAGQSVVAKYRADGSHVAQFYHRYMRVAPQAVGG